MKWFDTPTWPDSSDHGLLEKKLHVVDEATIDAPRLRATRRALVVYVSATLRDP